MKKRLLGLMYLLLATAAGAFAASRWTVNPHDYQYDMTAYVSIAWVQQEDYEVAAFCGDECRGVGKLLTADDGTKVFQLRIRSNTASGEVITFRAYNTTTEEELTDSRNITFEAQSVTGTPSKPIVLALGNLLQGDANMDGKVTITDAVAIVNNILGNASDNFNEAAADVNGDGKITITDAVGVVNIILSQGNE